MRDLSHSVNSFQSDRSAHEKKSAKEQITRAGSGDFPEYDRSQVVVVIGPCKQQIMKVSVLRLERTFRSKDEVVLEMRGTNERSNSEESELDE